MGRAGDFALSLDSPAGGERTLIVELVTTLCIEGKFAMNNVQLARNVYDAFGRGDIAAVLDLFESDMEWHPAEGHPFRPDGSPWIGRDAIAEGFFARIGEAWSSFTVTPRAFHDAHDAVVVEGRYTGVLKGSGHTIDAQFCHIWTTRDGKMRSFQQYMDTAKLQDAMGAR